MDKVQVKLIRTIVGNWYNIRRSSDNELILNAPLETVQKLLPNFSDNTTLATAEMDLNMIQEVKVNG